MLAVGPLFLLLVLQDNFGGGCLSWVPAQWQRRPMSCVMFHAAASLVLFPLISLGHVSAWYSFADTLDRLHMGYIYKACAPWLTLLWLLVALLPVKHSCMIWFSRGDEMWTGFSFSAAFCNNSEWLSRNKGLAFFLRNRKNDRIIDICMFYPPYS